MSDEIIYAIGDIHGDIMPLIVCLRDCCKVIKPNKPFLEETQDPYLITELEKEWNDASYDETLGYKWIGENAKVVLCGDILDNMRYESFLKKLKPYKKMGEYPMEEAKILKFINALNRDALKQKVLGKIYKVLGNHDLYNLNGYVKRETEHYKHYRYVSRYAENYEGYCQGANGRADYFYRGNPGSHLIAEGGAYIFLMIKDFIFVHGGIANNLVNFDNIIEANNYLMEYMTNNKKEMLMLDNEFRHPINRMVSDIIDGIVHDRSFGYKDIHHNETNMCNELYRKFDSLCLGMSQEKNTDSFWINKNECRSNRMKLIIGHCPQDLIFYPKTFSTSYTQGNELDGGKIIEYSGEVAVIDASNPMTDNINGITASCGDRTDNMFDKNKPSVYRVDISMSRAFNFKDFSDPSISHFKNKYLFSRTPQVLKIIYDKDNNPIVSIIKSSLKNTISQIPDIGIKNEIGQETPDILTCKKDIKKEVIISESYTSKYKSKKKKKQRGGNNSDIYKHKYLKYKEKYLKLKNINLGLIIY